MAGEMVPGSEGGTTAPMAGAMGGVPVPEDAQPPAMGGIMDVDAGAARDADGGTDPGELDQGMNPGTGGSMPPSLDAGPGDPMQPDAASPEPDAAPPEPDAAPPAPAAECVEMVAATQAFLALLEPAESASARAPFGGMDHRQFEFLPPNMRDRTGVCMRDLDQDELDALAAVLRAAMSAPGYQRLEAVRNLESALAMAESGVPVTDNRDPMNYYLQVFGEPRVDGDAPWGLRFEGHHLSMQAATVGCRLFTATPGFWGASPRTEPLAPMIDSSTTLWLSLAPEQQARAQVNFGIEGQDARPGPIQPQPALGLAAEEMDADQRALLRAVLAAYLDNMSAPIAADRFAAIEAAGVGAVHFAFRNGDFRVSGPTFLIDFVYHQGSRTHIHSSWRDYAGDFGDDLIARHMAAEHGDQDPEMEAPDPPPAPGGCPANCVDGAGACCGACLAANGVCYAESDMWCDTFNYRWCGD